jgi:RNA polymerase sigma-70 factor, ECF subfamily
MEATNNTGVTMIGNVYAASLPGPELASRPDPNKRDAVAVRTLGSSTSTRSVSRAVKQAQAGDRQALGFLYARYADNVYGYVRSIVHDDHEAEDVTQQVFAKLIKVIGKYEERDVPFFAWILRVSRNVAVDHIRQQRLIPVEEVRTSDEGWGDPAGRGRMRDLTDALSELPRAQREVLVLRHFAGLSPTEIAERTGRSEGSVHGLHHRGRRALKADLTTRGAAPTTGARGLGARGLGAVDVSG